MRLWLLPVILFGSVAVIAQSDPCASVSAPLAIIQCYRAPLPDHIDKAQVPAFLRAAAAQMNRAQVPGGPYGILRKATGNNCDGYSCDILCAGQGEAQRQHDVLIDERVPTWGAPMTVPGIRIDVCEIPPNAPSPPPPPLPSPPPPPAGPSLEDIHRQIAELQASIARLEALITAERPIELGVRFLGTARGKVGAPQVQP